MKKLLKQKELQVLAQPENEIRISIDQSTTACGCAIWLDGKLIKSGIFKPRSILTAGERILQIEKWLEGLVNTCSKMGKIKIIYLEDIQLQESINGSRNSFSGSQNNVLTFKTLARLQGVLINFCIKNNYDYSIVTPSSWKSICGIKAHYRDEQKKETISFVNSKFNINSKEDEADAICIGYSQFK